MKIILYLEKKYTLFGNISVGTLSRRNYCLSFFSSGISASPCAFHRLIETLTKSMLLVNKISLDAILVIVWFCMMIILNTLILSLIVFAQVLVSVLVID